MLLCCKCVCERKWVARSESRKCSHLINLDGLDVILSIVSACIVNYNGPLPFKWWQLLFSLLTILEKERERGRLTFSSPSFLLLFCSSFLCSDFYVYWRRFEEVKKEQKYIRRQFPVSRNFTILSVQKKPFDNVIQKSKSTFNGLPAS